MLNQVLGITGQHLLSLKLKLIVSSMQGSLICSAKVLHFGSSKENRFHA
jgi:hypothetical protein